MPIYKMEGKKDGKQKYRVCVNYTKQKGEYGQLERVAYGKEAAKALETKLNHIIERKKNKNPYEEMTIDELFEEYQRARKNQVRETTYTKSATIIRCHIQPFLGGERLIDINLKILQEWKLYMEDKEISTRTKKNAYREFRTLINYAVKMEYIRKNNLAKLGDFRDPFETVKKMEYYTSEEFLKFIGAARKYAEESDKMIDWGHYVFFNIAFYTGARKGEIHALKWSDIRGNILSITKSIAQKLKGADRTTPPKNKSSVRELQLPKPLIEILDEHHERCKAISGFSDDLYICGGVKPLRDETIRKRKLLYAELAGIKVIRVHDFRHSHASVLVNEGINIQEIARRLGHSNVQETWDTYAHMYPREEERAVTILNRIV